MYAITKKRYKPNQVERSVHYFLKLVASEGEYRAAHEDSTLPKPDKPQHAAVTRFSTIARFIDETADILTRKYKNLEEMEETQARFQSLSEFQKKNQGL